MQVSWWTFVANTLFWGVVLALKFAFDWWAIMKNLEIPVLGLWSRSILQDTDAHLRIAGCVSVGSSPGSAALLSWHYCDRDAHCLLLAAVARVLN